MNARFRARKGISLTHTIRNAFKNVKKGISWSLMSLGAKNAIPNALLARVSTFAPNAILDTFSPTIFASRHATKT